MRITPRALENITIDTAEIKIDVNLKDGGTIELRIHAQDPHKHRTDAEVYTWADELKKIDDTEVIFITPEEVKH